MATPRADLEKLTAPKLREFTNAKFPDITGVSGMKKEELIEAIVAEEVRLGLRPKSEQRQQATSAMGAGQLKTAIRDLKTARKTANERKDVAALKIARLQVKRMKRRLRKLRGSGQLRAELRLLGVHRDRSKCQRCCREGNPDSSDLQHVRYLVRVRRVAQPVRSGPDMASKIGPRRPNENT